MKNSLFLIAVLLMLPLNTKAQLYFSEPDPAEHLGPEWNYFCSVDSPYSVGAHTARGDTIFLTTTKKNDFYAQRILFSTSLGISWDTLPYLLGTRTFLPYPMDMHQGKAVIDLSDTTVRFVTTTDFGKTVDTVCTLPKEMPTYAYKLRATFGGGWWSSVDPQKMWVVFNLNDGEFSTDFYGRSRDGGKTWFQLGNLPRPLSGRGAMYEFLFDQTDSDIWYVSVRPVIDHSGPPQEQRWMTTDDGRTYRPISQWAPMAGIAQAGDMRAWSSGSEDRMGSISSSPYYIKGFNSYLPTDNGSSPPLFTNLIDRIIPEKEGYRRSLSPSQVTGAPLISYFLGVTESLIDTSSPSWPALRRWALITRDDGKTFDTITKRTPNGIIADPLTGRIWIHFYQGEYNGWYPRTEIYYSDHWKHLFKVTSGVERSINEKKDSWETSTTLVRGAERVFNLQVSDRSIVEVELMDALGRHLQTVFSSVSAHGDLIIPIKLDTALSPGIYFLIAKLDGKSLTKKLLVL